MELDTGVGHNFRIGLRAVPGQDDRRSALVKGKYVIDVGKGIELFGKVKFIDETDKRMNDAKLPAVHGRRLRDVGHDSAATTARTSTTTRQLDGRLLRQPGGHHGRTA